MVIRGRKINGKLYGAVISSASVLLLGWATWTTRGVQFATEKNVEQDKWIEGHEHWTQTVYPRMLSDFAEVGKRVERIETKLDGLIERLSPRSE